jgi:hypothetical protein
LLGYLHCAYLDATHAGALIAPTAGIIMPDDISKPRPATTELTKVPTDDPTVRTRRHAMNRPDDGEAFLPDPTRRGAHITAMDAESFGEEFVASATGGEPLHMDALDEVVEEEEGGPFLELDAEADAAADDAPESKDTAGSSEEGFGLRARGRNVRRSLSR